MKSIIIFFFIISSSFLYCQTKIVDYYPLSIRNRWIYEITTFSNDTKMKMEVEVIGYEETYQAFFVTSKMKPELYLPDMPFKEQLVISRNNKVLILSNRVAPMDTVWDIDTNRILIRYPIKVGTSWLSKENSVDTAEYKVLSLSDIKVQAGQFKNVFKVKKGVLGRSDGPKDIFIYYAPNIGMIKSEIINEGRPQGVIELISYTMK